MDDITLMATSIERMTKVIIFRKSSRGRGKEIDLKLNTSPIEVVKEFCYVGFILSKNINHEKQIRFLTGKAKAVIGKVWSLGERNFGGDWNRRTQLFDALVRSVMLFRAEIWGWEERKELEKLQNCYIKWTLQLDGHTLEYALLHETKREKIGIISGDRALKYDAKLRKETESSILRIVWENSRKSNNNFRKKEKGEFL